MTTIRGLTGTLLSFIYENLPRDAFLLHYASYDPSLSSLNFLPIGFLLFFVIVDNPFTVLLIGPVASGKSALLARLVHSLPFVNVLNRPKKAPEPSHCTCQLTNNINASSVTDNNKIDEFGHCCVFSLPSYQLTTEDETLVKLYVPKYYIPHFYNTATNSALRSQLKIETSDQMWADVGVVCIYIRIIDSSGGIFAGHSLNQYAITTRNQLFAPSEESKRENVSKTQLSDLPSRNHLINTNQVETVIANITQSRHALSVSSKWRERMKPLLTKYLLQCDTVAVTVDVTSDNSIETALDITNELLQVATDRILHIAEHISTDQYLPGLPNFLPVATKCDADNRQVFANTLNKLTELVGGCVSAAHAALSVRVKERISHTMPWNGSPCPKVLDSPLSNNPFLQHIPPYIETSAYHYPWSPSMLLLSAIIFADGGAISGCRENNMNAMLPILSTFKFRSILPSVCCYKPIRTRILHRMYQGNMSAYQDDRQIGMNHGYEEGMTATASCHRNNSNTNMTATPSTLANCTEDDDSASYEDDNEDEGVVTREGDSDNNPTECPMPRSITLKRSKGKMKAWDCAKNGLLPMPLYTYLNKPMCMQVCFNTFQLLQVYSATLLHTDHVNLNALVRCQGVTQRLADGIYPDNSHEGNLSNVMDNHQIERLSRFVSPHGNIQPASTCLFPGYELTNALSHGGTDTKEDNRLTEGRSELDHNVVKDAVLSQQANNDLNEVKRWMCDSELTLWMRRCISKSSAPSACVNINLISVTCQVKSSSNQSSSPRSSPLILTHLGKSLFPSASTSLSPSPRHTNIFWNIKDTGVTNLYSSTKEVSSPMSQFESREDSSKQKVPRISRCYSRYKLPLPRYASFETLKHRLGP